MTVTRLTMIFTAVLCAACATAGDVSLLGSAVPPGSVINPPEKTFPAVRRFPVKVAADSWVAVKSVMEENAGDRGADDVVTRVRSYFESDGDFPTARVVVTAARPEMTSGAEAQLVGGTSASRVTRTWRSTFTIEDWDNAAQSALTLSQNVKVVGTLKVPFGGLTAAVKAWTTEANRRGFQNVLAEMIDDLERNRTQLAALRARYVARGAATRPPQALAERIDRINRVETLLDEAERLNPGGAELAELRRRLESQRKTLRVPQ